MKLFSREQKGEIGQHAVLLFGGGLIGSAIDSALRGQAGWRVRAVPYSWKDDGRRGSELQAIKNDVSEVLSTAGRRAGPASRCDIVWAAGVSGFGSTTEHMAREAGLVTELCQAADYLASRCPQAVFTFHLMSSGGGLFEGKTRIGRDAAPAPLRPYGVAKLEQERIVLATRPRIRKQVYRPSSVYGFQPGGRRGLFTTLIANVLTNKTTLISGTERTIRDYVFAGDIGRFVGRSIVTGGEGDATHLLASGKPTSMFEVISTIEALLGRPAYRRFERDATNALDLSFARSALPSGWATTPLAVGLATIHRHIQQAYVRRRSVARSLPASA